MNNMEIPYVKLEKISAVDAPNVETSSKEDFKLGEANPQSPFVGYTLEGYLTTEVHPHEPIHIIRTIRNGEKLPGIFSSSKVTKIDGDLIYTLNSVYRLTELPTPKNE